jgi:acyl-coenzyme A synthetase/AMP-(fatty) acid ligase
MPTSLNILDTGHWTLDPGSANNELTNARRDGEHALRAKLSGDGDGALQGGINAPIIVCEDVIEATDEANNLPDHVGGSLVDVSHVIYTSGTTGVPKGVVCEHVSLAAYARAKAEVG